MSPADQRRQALMCANAKRANKATLRGDLRLGHRTLFEVLSDPPECIRDVPLFEVASYPFSSWPSMRMQKLGEAALSKNINLMLPVGATSTRVRSFVAQFVNPGGWKRR